MEEDSAKDKFHDECGVFGIFGHPEAARLTYLGLYALQHRGQESCGIVASDGQELRSERAMGLVSDPRTGKSEKDLSAAQLAIDCVQFLIGKVENDLSESERRDAQRRLNDLRMNYVAKLREE